MANVVDEASSAGLDGSHPVTLQAKMLRQELLQVKADLERELGALVLDSLYQAMHTDLDALRTSSATRT